MDEIYPQNKKFHSVSSHFERLFYEAFLRVGSVKKLICPHKNIFIVVRLAAMLCIRTP